MAATLAPQLDAPESLVPVADHVTAADAATVPAPARLDDLSPTPAVDPLPLVNPITVSMALAVLFLLVVFAAVSLRPPPVDDTRGADEAPILVEEAHAGG